MNNTKLVISNWVGRFGNNVIQMVNCLSIAFHYQCNVQIPAHQYFNQTNLILFNTNKDNSTTQIISNHFFHLSDIKFIQFDVNWIQIYFKQIQSVLKNIFNIKSSHILPDTTLLIHIRSGDIFRKNPHPGYIPQPLSYYTKIIDSGFYTDILIVSEDQSNPCIDKLTSIYKNIKISDHVLDHDMKLVLSAPNIVMSTGTFIPALLIFSEHIKHIYKPLEFYVHMCNQIMDQIEVTTISLKLYYQLIGKWVNSDDQRELMLKFKLD